MDGAGDGFFHRASSTKHHLAYPGGLVEHSVNVFRELRKVVIDNEPTMERCPSVRCSMTCARRIHTCGSITRDRARSIPT